MRTVIQSKLCHWEEPVICDPFSPLICHKENINGTENVFFLNTGQFWLADNTPEAQSGKQLTYTYQRAKSGGNMNNAV